MDIKKVLSWFKKDTCNKPVKIKNYKRADKFSGRAGVLTSVNSDEADYYKSYVGTRGHFVSQCGATYWCPDVRRVHVILNFPYEVLLDEE